MKKTILTIKPRVTLKYKIPKKLVDSLYSRSASFMVLKKRKYEERQKVKQKLRQEFLD